MADTNQTNLREPDQINWDNYATGSKYTPPPQAKGADGKYIVYTGQLPTNIGLDVTQEGYRSFVLDPIKLVKNGNGVDGYEIRFTRASVKKFTDRNGNPIDASMAGNVLRAAGIVAKPQSNKEYEAAFNQAKSRIVPFTVEWEARNKETGEEVKGYDNFPLDPERPGLRKSVLRQGDLLADGKTAVKSEVLFANARVKFFQDPNRK